MAIPSIFRRAERRHTYLLRKWLKDPGEWNGTQAQIVVISEFRRLMPWELRDRLEELQVGEPKDFVLVEMNPMCSAVLDTWEPGIEGVISTDDFEGPCELWRHWWDMDACERVEDTDV